MTHEIIAFAEQRDGKLKKAALEVVTAARKLGDSLGVGVTAVAFSEGTIEDSDSLGAHGATEFLHGQGEGFASYAPGTFAHAIADLAKERGAKAVLLPHSAMGKDLAPRISALLDVPQVSDCVGLEIVDGAIVARRPVYAGKARWSVRSNASTFLGTLRPNVFTPELSGAPVVASPFSPEPRAARVVLKTTVEPEGEKKIELTEADAIVSGGRGLGGPEHFPVIEALAAELGAAVGASRAVVDAGWRPHGDQVGQTGKTVSPNLYIACGISGAIQHLAGMSSSRVIVAINKDPEAPIFKVANYGIVGDLFEVVPALTKAVKSLD